MRAEISLRELEGKVHGSPQVLVAAAELEQQINLYEREQAISGWKVFAGVSNGAYQESSNVNTTRRLNQAAVKVGLRYPLLGTRTREQLNILHAEARGWEIHTQLPPSTGEAMRGCRPMVNPLLLPPGRGGQEINYKLSPGFTGNSNLFLTRAASSGIWLKGGCPSRQILLAGQGAAPTGGFTAWARHVSR